MSSELMPSGLNIQLLNSNPNTKIHPFESHIVLPYAKVEPFVLGLSKDVRVKLYTNLYVKL